MSAGLDEEPSTIPWGRSLFESHSKYGADKWKYKFKIPDANLAYIIRYIAKY